MFEGIVFGIVDNGVLALCALWGIDIDQKLSGKGINGALFGALWGNTLSDFLGGVFDFGFFVSLNIALGCMAIIPLVSIYTRWKNAKN
jgi:hypothetical protein